MEVFGLFITWSIVGLLFISGLFIHFPLSAILILMFLWIIVGFTIIHIMIEWVLLWVFRK